MRASSPSVVLSEESHVVRNLRPHALYVRMVEHPQPKYALLLVHGTAGHSGCYSEFALTAARLGASVYSFDCHGHGRSEGPPGVFTMEGMIADVRAVAGYLRRRVRVPIVVLGASQGGEVAYHAAQTCHAVAGIICMNLLLAGELSMNWRIRLMRSGAARWLDAVVGDRLRVPLRRVIDFERAYADKPGLLASKVHDPLYVWSYGFRSYRSVFSYHPPHSPAHNTHPIMVCCGENDPIVPPAHNVASFERLGGPKTFYCMPNTGHQLMNARPEKFARTIDSWIQHRVIKHATAPWRPPDDDVERQIYLKFVHSQSARRTPYRLSIVDRLLALLANGRIATGVRFFARERTSEYGRFISEQVAQIDLTAWQYLRQHLPDVGRLAVIGCGDGLGIERLLAALPELAHWDIVGIDVEPDAIAAAKQRFADAQGRIRFVAGDAADPNTFGGEPFDVIHCHGILDHCADHQGVIRACFRALRGRGRFFYVTPDRNWYTWLAFVSVGPRFLFRLSKYSGFHDYRFMPRAAELAEVLLATGFHLTEPPVGIEYVRGPLAIRRGARARNLGDLRLQLARPRWWLNGGYAGEYAGVAEKP